jgi:tetratricopeptide (TPR) repeat protein
MNALGQAAALVDTYRSGLATDAGYYGPLLAEALIQLSQSLDAAGRRDEAVIAADEGVDLYEDLSDGHSSFREPYAWATFHLGLRIRAAGRVDEGHAVMADAIAIYRSTHGADPQRRRLAVAKALGDRAWYLLEDGRLADAVTAGEESVALYREAREEDPGSHTGELAETLHTVARALADLDRVDEAAQLCQRAVNLCRQAAKTRPELTADLARMLDTLGRLSVQIGKYAEAVAATKELCQVRRELSTSLEPAERIQLGRALNRLTGRLEGRSSADEVLAVAREAVKTWRPIAQAHPDQESGLVLALARCVRAERQAGVQDTSAGAKEALAIAKRLADTGMVADVFPAAVADEVWRSLHSPGQDDEGVAVLGASVPVWRAGTQRDPKARVSFTIALADLANVMLELGRPEQALTAAEERVAVARELHRENPARRAGLLASALRTLADCLGATGRTDEATAARAEAATLTTLSADQTSR